MSVHTIAGETYDVDEENSDDETTVGTLATSCLNCSSILPTDTTRSVTVGCPSCRHVTEVSR